MEEKVSARVKKALQKKVDDHNKKYGDDARKRATLKMLIAVFRRGVGAYNTNPQSVRPSVTSSDQWAYARVNSFLYCLRTLKFRGGKGVATALGGLFAAKLSLGLFASLLFISAYSASQNVGASSMMTCLLLIIYSIIFGEAYLLMSAGFVLIRHHDNYQKMRLKQLWNPLF